MNFLSVRSYAVIVSNKQQEKEEDGTCIIMSQNTLRFFDLAI